MSLKGARACEGLRGKVARLQKQNARNNLEKRRWKERVWKAREKLAEKERDLRLKEWKKAGGLYLTDVGGCHVAEGSAMSRPVGLAWYPA